MRRPAGTRTHLHKLETRAYTLQGRRNYRSGQNNLWGSCGSCEGKETVTRTRGRETGTGQNGRGGELVSGQTGTEAVPTAGAAVVAQQATTTLGLGRRGVAKPRVMPGRRRDKLGGSGLGHGHRSRRRYLGHEKGQHGNCGCPTLDCAVSLHEPGEF